MQSRRGTPGSTQLHPPLCIVLEGPRCWGVPRLGGALRGGGMQLPPPFWGAPQAAGKGCFMQLRTRSCISASGEAGGVSRWRRNLLFAPVLQEAGGRKGGGGVCWQLLLFNFIFLPPSRNLCNVPAAPWEAGAAVSHCCRWNVTQSCCSPRQDMTRLPKPGRSPSTIACPRQRARTREIPPESSAPRFPQGYQPIAVGQSSGWGGRMGSFIYFDLFFLLFFSP